MRANFEKVTRKIKSTNHDAQSINRLVFTSELSTQAESHGSASMAGENKGAAKIPSIYAKKPT